MADDRAAKGGLPWPADYRDLLPAIREAWGVKDAIYLIRALSGKSGAKVYTADVTSAAFTGQAILKLDHAPHPGWQEQTEVERHRRAVEVAPDFAAAHLPRLLHSLHHGDKIASLSTIAAHGLEYARPWIDCPYDQQVSVVHRMSLQLLEGWNRDYRMADGLQTPHDLLRAWLAYRLDPEQGRIYGFVTQHCGLARGEPSFTFEGHWYPNPLAFMAADSLPEQTRLRAIIGNQHCDLHGYNLLVGGSAGDEPSYYLIDLAMYRDDQFLLFDHAYFELSYLLEARDQATWPYWDAILHQLREFRRTKGRSGLKSDDLGMIQLVSALRDEVFTWVHAHESHRLSNMESQYLLARVAAGLSFTHKRMPANARALAFVYAASNLKDYLEFHGVDWPKHGPPLALAGDEAPDAAPHADPRPGGVDVAAPAAARAVRADAPATDRRARPNTRATARWAAIAVLVVIAAAAAGVWYWRPALLFGDTTPLASRVLPVPEKPSVAVLPFDGFPANAESDMLAHGMTYTITTALAQVPDLTVISRHTTYHYKDQLAEIRKIAAELKVRYLVHGTLQRQNDQLRVAVELINGTTGELIWSKKYDRKPDEVFALEDEIALNILVFLQVKLTDGHQAATRGDATTNLEAYLLFLKAQKALLTYTRDGIAEARKLTENIETLDPQYRPGYILDARTHLADAWLGYADAKASLAKAAEILQKAAALDGKITDAERGEILISEAAINLYEGKFDKALEAGRKAVSLAPNNADLLAVYGAVLYFSGDYDRSILFLERAMRLHPFYASWYPLYLSRDYVFKGDTARAIKWAEDGIARAESDFMRALNMANLVFAYYEAGRAADAKRVASEMLKLAPHFTSAYYRKIQPYRDPKDWARFAEALKDSGIS